MIQQHEQWPECKHHSLMNTMNGPRKGHNIPTFPTVIVHNCFFFVFGNYDISATLKLL